MASDYIFIPIFGFTFQYRKYQVALSFNSLFFLMLKVESAESKAALVLNFHLLSPQYLRTM